MVDALTFGARVKAARERRKWTQRDLASASGLSQPTLHRIETQARTATMPELIRVAAALGTTLGDLTDQSEVRDRLVFAARTNDGAAAEDMKDRLAVFLEVDAHLQLLTGGSEAPPTEGDATMLEIPYLGPEEAAREFRERQHLGTAPIADLVSVLETLPQVHVAVLSKTAADHHGMRAHDSGRGVTLLAACATAHAVRLRSTLAHELGHHLFRDPTPTTWSAHGPEENRATAFARHLLIPREGLIDLLGAPGSLDVDEEDLSGIVERFAVSPAMAAIQLREAGFITAEVAARFSALTTPGLATRYGWSALYRQWSNDSQMERPPRRIMAGATVAYLNGDLSIDVLANLRDLSREEVRAELDDAGLVPRSRVIEDVEDDVDWSLGGGEDATDGA